MALSMQRDYGDRVHTIFVESQGADASRVESFAMGKKWLDTAAMWTTERPMITRARGLPNCVVLDADGRVAAMGHPTALHKQIEELIQAAARPKPPEDLPRELKGAWKDLARGKLVDARKEAQKIAERSADPAVTTAAEGMVREVVDRAERAVGRIARMVADGAFLAARDRAETLADDLDGLEAAATAADWHGRLDGDEFAAEIAAEKDLAKVRAVVFAAGPDPRYARALQKLADDHPGTHAARTALRWIPLMRE